MELTFQMVKNTTDLDAYSVATSGDCYSVKI